MVHGDFIDHYYNNTLKFSVALKYISTYCTNTRYVLIIDGDYSINVERSWCIACVVDPKDLSMMTKLDKFWVPFGTELTPCSWWSTLKSGTNPYNIRCHYL